MAPDTKFTGLVQMLASFIEAKEASYRGTNFVAQIESEFARVGLDEDEEFSDLPHALAMYRGREEDIRALKNEALFAIRCLATR